MKEPPVKVAVVDDHLMFRAGISNLLSEDENIQIVFDAKDGVDLQKKIEQYGLPDVVLMDVSMPVMDGCDATKWLKRKHPSVHVLALSMDNLEAKIIKMIKYGAGGYLLKTSSIDELLKGIFSIAKTGLYLNEYVTGRIVNGLRSEKDNPGFMLDSLTPREKEFIFLCCSEYTYKEIALRMDISVKTVNNYREDLFSKLNVGTRVGLVLYALKHHIIKIEDIPD